METVVQLDTIISRNGKNVYVIYKGNDVLPATPLDVYALSYESVVSIWTQIKKITCMQYYVNGQTLHLLAILPKRKILIIIKIYRSFMMQFQNILIHEVDLM